MWLCSGDAGRDALCCWPCPHRASGPSESFPPIPPAAHWQPPRLAGPPELRVGPAGQRCPPAGPPHPRECAREALIAGTSAHPPLLAPAVARMRSGRGGKCSGRSEGRACVARTRRTQGRRRCRRTPVRGRGSRAAGWGPMPRRGGHDSHETAGLQS